MPSGFEPITFFTPDYAAPEQFRGEESSIGPWTDVFALALVLVELMLGGRPALRGNSLDALRATSEDPTERPTPRAHGLELPNAVESVFERALAVEPHDRFHTAGDFLQALDRSIVCEGRPPTQLRTHGPVRLVGQCPLQLGGGVSFIGNTTRVGSAWSTGGSFQVLTTDNMHVPTR